MKIGIYKWVSPSGRIYVGQSRNIDQRKDWYLSGGIKNAPMPKLKRSFKKYGIENHIFDVIEYCTLEELNEREIYWGLFFNTLNEGLNCKLGEQNCIFSEETKDKMREAKLGKSLPQEVKTKIGESNMGQKRSQETKNKMIISRTGGVRSQETKNEMSKTRSKTPYHIKPVIQVKNGIEIEYISQTEASLLTGVSIGSISACCTGRTKTAAGFIWKYKK